MKRNNKKKKKKQVRTKASLQLHLLAQLLLPSPAPSSVLLHHFISLLQHARTSSISVSSSTFFFFYSAAAPILPPAASACTRSPTCSGLFVVSASRLLISIAVPPQTFHFVALTNISLCALPHVPFPTSHFSFPHFYFADSYDLWLSLSASRLLHVCVWALAFISHISSCLHSPHTNFLSLCAFPLHF